MFNRCCCSVRLGISRQRITFPCIRRSFGTSNDDSGSSQTESLQKSEASGKIRSEIRKESRSRTPNATTNENLKPENIRSNFFAFIKFLFFIPLFLFFISSRMQAAYQIHFAEKLLEFKGKKQQIKPKPNDVVTKEILTAVDSVVKNLHDNGISDERK